MIKYPQLNSSDTFMSETGVNPEQRLTTSTHLEQLRNYLSAEPSKENFNEVLN